MVEPIDIQARIDELTFLHGRTPDTNAAAESAAFARFGTTPGGDIFAGGFSGQSAWERHPNGDEIVQVLGGETQFELIDDNGRKQYTLSAGMMVIVPADRWHRFISPEGVTLMTVTPLPTETTNKDYPIGEDPTE